MSQNNPLTALLENQPFVVLDGAMATELEARGWTRRNPGR